MVQRTTDRRRGGQGLAIVVAVFALLLSGCRCGLRHRGPFDNDVVAARELNRLGIEAVHRQSLPEAHARFAAALKTNPNDVESRYQLSRVLWRQGHTDRAIEEMDEAIRQSGSNPAWTVELGQMLLSQSEFAGGLECSNRALAGCCDLPAAWRLQAEVFQATGRMDEALQAYHQALATGDDSVAVLSQIATIYRRQGRSRRALSTLQRMEDQVPVDKHPPELGFWQGLALQELGRHEDAIELFADSQHRMGDDPNLLASMAASRAKLGLDTMTASSSVQLATAEIEPQESKPYATSGVAPLGTHVEDEATGVRQAVHVVR